MTFQNKFYPLISRPTRFTEYCSTLIDNILTNCVDEVHESKIIINGISDHPPVYCINYHKIVNNRETCATFSQRLIDANIIKDFESKLNAVKWDIKDSIMLLIITLVIPS